MYLLSILSLYISMHGPAPIAQRIEQGTSKPEMYVRFVLGAPKKPSPQYSTLTRMAVWVMLSYFPEVEEGAVPTLASLTALLPRGHSMVWLPSNDDAFEDSQAKKRRLRTRPNPTEAAYHAEVALGALPIDQTALRHWFRLDQIADKVPAS